MYSRSAIELIYVETRNGGAIRANIGPRVWVRGYAQVGTNAYPFGVRNPVTGQRRVDDALIYGGDVGVRVGPTVIQALVTQNVLRPRDGLDNRTVFRFTTGISYNGEWTK